MSRKDSVGPALAEEDEISDSSRDDAFGESVPWSPARVRGWADEVQRQSFRALLSLFPF
jgi:hypothetical protein